MSELVTVYVRLLREGTDVWRPANARPDGIAYRLLVPASSDEDEQWEFAPGSLVKCEQRTFSDGQVLVAVASVKSSE
jgi:hypothetical protein